MTTELEINSEPPTIPPLLPAPCSASGVWSEKFPPPGKYQVRCNEPENRNPPGTNWLTDWDDVVVTNDPEYPIAMKHFTAGRAYAKGWLWWMPNDQAQRPGGNKP